MLSEMRSMHYEFLTNTNRKNLNGVALRTGSLLILFKSLTSRLLACYDLLAFLGFRNDMPIIILDSIG